MHKYIGLFIYRLTSAYVNKCVEKGSVGRFNKKLRKHCNSFPEFVNYVLTEYHQSDCHKYYNRLCVTINVHWRPFNARCAYCDIPYNMIGRAETFDEDVRYLLLKNNLTNIIQLKNVHANKSGAL